MADDRHKRFSTVPQTTKDKMHKLREGTRGSFMPTKEKQVGRRTVGRAATSSSAVHICGSVRNSRFSLRILLGVWLLVATVLVNSYSGTFVSYLTAPKMMPSINTLEDLSVSKDVSVLELDNNLMGQQILVEFIHLSIIKIGLSVSVSVLELDNTVIGQQIMDAKSGTFKMLGDQVRRNPDRILHNMESANTLLETRRYALPFFQSFCDDFVAKNFKKDGNCRFKTTDPISNYQFFSLPLLKKNSKFTSEFYLAQMKAWEMGLPQHWMKTSTKQAPECSAKKRPEASRKMPININDLFDSFLVFSIEMGLAILAFLMKKIVGKLTRQTSSIDQ